MITTEQMFASEVYHIAWRVTYTHIDGNTYESTMCGAKGMTEDYLKSRDGIAKIDCVAQMHRHNQDCEDRGAVEGEESLYWGKTRKLIQFDRKAA